MRIDDQVEPLVREALTAVVKSDPDRLRQAFAAFPDGSAMTSGARLATAVALFVLNDVYGRRPTPAEVRSVADKLVELEDWTDISSDEVTTFLTAAYGGTRADRILPADRIAPLAYVIAGNLLSSCCKEGEFWFNYLDRAESGLEASADD
jgi:hypothetical protein